MKNKKNITVYVVIIVAFILIVYFVGLPGKKSSTSSDDGANFSTTTQDVQPKTTTKTPSSSYINKQGYYVIQYTNSGFMPKTIQVPKGKSIKFVNNSSRGMRIFTDSKTSDQWFVELNQPTTVSKGAEYTLTVPSSGLWNYYNQTYPSHSASIIVY